MRWILSATSTVAPTPSATALKEATPTPTDTLTAQPTKTLTPTQTSTPKPMEEVDFLDVPYLSPDSPAMSDEAPLVFWGP